MLYITETHAVFESEQTGVVEGGTLLPLLPSVPKLSPPDAENQDRFLQKVAKDAKSPWAKRNSKLGRGTPQISHSSLPSVPLCFLCFLLFQISPLRMRRTKTDFYRRSLRTQSPHGLNGTANPEEAHQVHRAIKLGRIFATKGTEGTKRRIFSDQ